MDIKEITKPINSLKIKKSDVEKRIFSSLGKESVIKKIINELKISLDKYNFLFLNNGTIIYDNRIEAIYPNTRIFPLVCLAISEFRKNSKKYTSFYNFQGKLITFDEIRRCICRVSNPIKSGKRIYVNENSSDYALAAENNASAICLYDIDDSPPTLMSTEPSAKGYFLPVYHLNTGNGNGKPPQPNAVLEKLIKNNLTPDILAIEDWEGEAIEYYHKLLKLYADGILQLSPYKNTLKLEINFANVRSVNIDETIFDNFLKCEETRANISMYDPKILTDPNRGHWDLWEEDNSANDDDYVKINLGSSIMARNPIADIKSNGIVGIDFGTKSTVVAYQENNEHTLPMRIGIGDYTKKIEASHYENPTVMEFIGIDEFINAYNSKQGRPETKWNDITISHTANNRLENCDSSMYYSYLNELKQWAGNSAYKLRIIDQRGGDMVLPPLLELEDGEFNPIEIYAYYLGLNINNMFNGIYLNYLLSYPITYDVETREKIRDSFEKGLKKSLPVSILKNETIMNNMFRVSLGASEPAAYAVTAMEELNFPFDVTGETEYNYAVFDFGGGTTDFDFGVWREANRKDSRRYDYVITHYGAQGDRYLGGENILELLAFEVFKDNQDVLREKELTFILPPECKRFPGGEILLSDSQEAKRNTRQMMEIFRPLWERHENYEDMFKSGVIKADLYNKDGDQCIGVEFNIQLEKLEQIIKDRITKGVDQFFSALFKIYKLPDTGNVKNINILLAGNSSKSQILMDVFNEKIEEHTTNIRKEYNSEGEFFKIFRPLGAVKSTENETASIDANVESSIAAPTGKTGVAFGLIKSRKGSRIKVENRNLNGDNNNIAFKYYLGYNRKGKFEIIIDKMEEYNKWINFIDAGVDDFEIFYTALPSATGGQLGIDQTMRENCRIKTVDETANVYVRLVSPNEIEYTVAFENDIPKDKYLDEVQKIKLLEKGI